MGLMNKKYVPLYFDDVIHRELAVYAKKTGQTIQQVVKAQTDACVQEIIKLVGQIKEMEKEAFLKQIREEEAQRIASEHPIQVSGKTEDPIGSLEIVQSVSQ